MLLRKRCTFHSIPCQIRLLWRDRFVSGRLNRHWQMQRPLRRWIPYLLCLFLKIISMKALRIISTCTLAHACENALWKLVLHFISFLCLWKMPYGILPKQRIWIRTLYIWKQFSLHLWKKIWLCYQAPVPWRVRNVFMSHNGISPAPNCTDAKCFGAEALWFMVQAIIMFTDLRAV